MIFVKNQIVDYHPHSDNIIRDIVHPVLYSYVKGASPLLKSEEENEALSYDPSIGEADRIEVTTGQVNPPIDGSFELIMEPLPSLK